MPYSVLLTCYPTNLITLYFLIQYLYDGELRPDARAGRKAVLLQEL
jgi:hypothetical protein